MRSLFPLLRFALAFSVTMLHVSSPQRITWGIVMQKNDREGVMANNPRYQNGNLRRKHRARMRAMGLPCHICGRPIHYDEPSDSNHPLSFVIDEVIPISKAEKFGYNSRREAAEDWNNLAPAHYACNAMKSNRLPNEKKVQLAKVQNVPDGQW